MLVEQHIEIMPFHSERFHHLLYPAHVINVLRLSTVVGSWAETCEQG